MLRYSELIDSAAGDKDVNASSSTSAIKVSYNESEFTVLFDSRPGFYPLVLGLDGSIKPSSNKTREIIAKAEGINAS